jgi:hypothetical protein
LIYVTILAMKRDGGIRWFMPAHPSHKDKDAARVGHPESSRFLLAQNPACEFSAFPPIAKNAMDGAPSFIRCGPEKPVDFRDRT